MGQVDSGSSGGSKAPTRTCACFIFSSYTVLNIPENMEKHTTEKIKVNLPQSKSYLRSVNGVLRKVKVSFRFVL
jgi:hypothetical protein